MSKFVDGFITTHNKNIDKALYRIGDHVEYKHPDFGGEGKILAVSDTGDGIEYAITDAPFLLWESEIIDRETSLD